MTHTPEQYLLHSSLMILTFCIWKSDIIDKQQHKQMLRRIHALVAQSYLPVHIRMEKQAKEISNK